MICQNKIFITSQCDKSTLQFSRDLFKESQQPFPENEVQSQLKTSDGDVAGIMIPFLMETKYYTASLDLWLDEFKELETTIQAYTANEQIGQAIGAFVFIFSQADDFKRLKRWLPFLNKTEPAIRLCIHQNHQDPEDINAWCLDHGFDYVDMNESPDYEMDKVGMALALEILQTHLWDGLERKDKQGSIEEEELVKEIQDLRLLEDENLDMPTASEINEMRDKLFGTLEDDDLDKTFTLLQSMKEHGKTLSDEERRKMAAQVALSFAAQLGI
ncbi:hypothetical protein BY458DRAFT_541707 [Sporodiniella umbellata]|nr:hypothetical protein BY458DRAFT_541707 [Sporodiniella umbellata]